MEISDEFQKYLADTKLRQAVYTILSNRKSKTSNIEQALEDTRNLMSAEYLKNQYIEFMLNCWKEIWGSLANNNLKANVGDEDNFGNFNIWEDGAAYQLYLWQKPTDRIYLVIQHVEEDAGIQKKDFLIAGVCTSMNSNSSIYSMIEEAKSSDHYDTISTYYEWGMCTWTKSPIYLNELDNINIKETLAKVRIEAENLLGSIFKDRT